MDNMKLEEYEYDRNGNRIRIQTKESSTNQVQLEYYKNNAGGNTAMVKYDGEWWYTYDNNGNRTSKGKKLKEKGAEYITANEKENGSREGNITLDTDYEYWEYTWDLYNRLVKVEQKKDEDNDSLVCVTYKYDGLNHRIERNSILEDTKTKYVYGRNGALTYEEFIKNGTKVGTRSYSYIYDQIIGFTDNENGIQKKRYAVTDVLGTVSEIYSEENELLWKASYTAFGIPQVATTDKLEGVFEFHGMFSGCQFDEETSLSYHWNRWRNEAGNSFISEDPIRDGSNWYGYAGQNPINFVDRKGLEEEQTTTNSNLFGEEIPVYGDPDNYLVRIDELTAAKILERCLNHLGDNYIYGTKDNNWNDYRCDNFTEKVLTESNQNPAEYMDQDAKKTINQHIDWALKNNKTTKTNRSEKPSSFGLGAFVVYMNEGKFKNGKVADSHGGIIIATLKDIKFIDNSSHNNQIAGTNEYNGGVELHTYNSILDFQADYGTTYKSFYYLKIESKDVVQ